MGIIIAIIVAVIFAAMDASASSAVMLGFTLLIGSMMCFDIPGKQRKDGFSLFAIVFCLYISIAYIVSLSFSGHQFFYVSDSMRYIADYLGRTSFFFSTQDFYDCYFSFSDSNILFNAYLNEMAMIMNHHFGGMTVYSMTLCITMFGVYSSIFMYRIFLRHFDSKKAFRYVLIFSLCSPFFLYSTVIIRDILICFLYIVAFDIIDRKFSVTGLILLIAVMLLAWGVRLYSGIFISAFIWYYIFLSVRRTAFKAFGTVLTIFLGIVALSAVLGSALYVQTTEDLMGFEELSMERSAGGVVSRLMSLPPGISNLAIVFFTMIRPLPPLAVYEGVASFSNFTIASLSLISGFFWFVTFYMFVFMLVFNHQFKRMDFEKLLMLGICFLFLFVNAAHPDFRRMLPVYPALYLLIMDGVNAPDNVRSAKRYRSVLIISYVIMALAFLAI